LKTYINNIGDISKGKKVIALGSFDGIHAAHKILLNTTVEAAKKKNIESMVYTFTNHPSQVLSNMKIELLSDNAEKTKLIEKEDIDILYFQDFNIAFSHIEPEAFIESILINVLNADTVVAGYNYRFGTHGKGNTELLRKVCGRFGVEVLIIDKVEFENEVISSTNIRNYLKSGMIIKANSMLGRHYSLTGNIIHGNSLGSKLGFPTANMKIPFNRVIPKSGVYHTVSTVNGISYRSVTNIGIKPTVQEKGFNEISIETHLIDMGNADLYGHMLKIEFIDRIRDEQKFDDLNELTAAVMKDISLVKNYKA
jgi:riboflavin kinase/FMN adenylyltransferase